MKIEYVISGLSFFKLGMKEINEDEFLRSDIIEILKKFNEYYSNNQISLLFNAFSEKDFAEWVPSLETDTYVDSGGLQMITLKNVELNDKTRQDIYETQAKGTFAMCFDEIPLYIDENKKGNSARTDMSGKYVVGEEIYEKGVATGNNIKKQIQYFEECGTDTKVFVILQGNSPQDWINFCDGVFSIVTEEFYPYIEGLSIADTCIGNGILEAADMISIIPKLNCPEKFKKRLHLLGVGSINRLIPILTMVNSGYLPEDTHISYDSTSISASHAFGRYLTEDRTIKFDRVQLDQNDVNIDSVIHDILNNIKDLNWDENVSVSWTEENLKKRIRESTTNTFGKIHEDEDKEKQKSNLHYGVLFHLIFTLSQIVNFMKRLNKIIETPESLQKHILQTSKLKPLVTLINVTTYDEYVEWRKGAIGQRLPSNRIVRVETYEEFNRISTSVIDEWI